MKKLTAMLLGGALLTSTAGPLLSTADAQNYNGYYRGARSRHVYNDRYDRNYYESERYHKAHSGIGPGKGAAIGGVGGAALGAVFGGGMKGALIGGAAGAGIGALLGKSAEDKRHEKYGRY